MTLREFRHELKVWYEDLDHEEVQDSQIRLKQAYVDWCTSKGMSKAGYTALFLTHVCDLNENNDGKLKLDVFRNDPTLRGSFRVAIAECVCLYDEYNDESDSDESFFN